MAKQKNEQVILENVELKPQVIGFTFKKKSNLFRVIIIFIVFGLAVYYINDISVYFNKLIGRETAETIDDLAGSNDKKPSLNQDNEDDDKDTDIDVTDIDNKYNVYTNTLTIDLVGLTINNFNITSNILTFDVSNNSDSMINLSSRKFYIETYSQDKTLLERFKADFKILNVGGKENFKFDIKETFYYIAITEKKVEDYPNVELLSDNNGKSILTCVKDYETIIYTFKNNELIQINHTVSDSNTSDSNYSSRLSSYQSKVNTYNTLNGVTATFNSSLAGYSATFALDLKNVSLSSIPEKYYYAYGEVPKVVNFEMEAYNFSCK